MRRGMWAAAAAALVVVLSGAGGLGGGGRVLAADGRVTIGGDTESDINKWGFTPKELTVPAGTTVVWHNGGQQSHTVTADDGKSFSSPMVAPGGDFQFAFTNPGDYPYHCEPHPFMKAVVHVVGGATASTAATTAPTQPNSTGTPTTATTARPGQPTTSTAPASGSTTTTASTGQASGSGTTTTTLAPAVTPTSAPDSASSTTTTTAAPKSDESAASRHRPSNHHKSSPLGITFAAVSTLVLTAIAAKLLASKP